MASPRKRKAAIRNALSKMLESEDPKQRELAHEYMSMSGPQVANPADPQAPTKTDEEWLVQKAEEMGVIAEEKKTSPVKAVTKNTPPKTTKKAKKPATKKTTKKKKR